MTDEIHRFKGKSSAPTNVQAALGHLEVGQGVSKVTEFVLGLCGVYSRNKSGALHRVNKNKVKIDVD